MNKECIIFYYCSKLKPDFDTDKKHSVNIRE